MKKDVLIITILATIVTIILAVLLCSLVYWGLGKLIIYVFHIDYNWTFLHGLVTAIVCTFLKGIFGTTTNKGE